MTRNGCRFVWFESGVDLKIKKIFKPIILYEMLFVS